MLSYSQAKAVNMNTCSRSGGQPDPLKRTRASGRMLL